MDMNKNIPIQIKLVDWVYSEHTNFLEQIHTEFIHDSRFAYDITQHPDCGVKQVDHRMIFVCYSLSMKWLIC